MNKIISTIMHYQETNGEQSDFQYECDVFDADEPMQQKITVLHGMSYACQEREYHDLDAIKYSWVSASCLNWADSGLRLILK